ncbi:MAG: S9 family peptidase, partial [Syntrophothermus sp.]
PPQGFFKPAPSQMQWRGKATTYVFVYQNNLVSGKPGSAVRDTLLKLEELNSKLSAISEEPLKRFPAITFKDENSFTFSAKNKYFLFSFNPRLVKYINSIPNAGVNADFEPESGRIAYTRANNLYVALDGRQVAVTSEQNPDIVYGSEKVHRNEFGITKGTFWSPGGKLLAFYRMDQSMVKDYPLVDISTRIATLQNTKYPMAGMASHQVTVGIYNASTGNTLYLKTGGDPEHYLTNITWSSDGKSIYIAELNRDQNHLALNRYDPVTGNFIKTLFEEKSDAYVEPVEGLFFLNNDPAQFLWLSRRDGYNHIYRYDTSGKLLRQLTRGEWEVASLIGLDAKMTEVYFSAHKENPLMRQVYSVNLKSGVIKLLTPVHGTHDAWISDDGRYLLDRYSSTDTYSKLMLYDQKGKKPEELFDVPDPLTEYDLGKTSIFTIKNENNTDLYCRLIRPAGFDSTRKYPVVIYVYGGPHSQMIGDSWLGGGGLFLNFLASQGYLVFTLDNRGTSYRGLAFEQAIFRNLGTVEVADQMKGVEYLKSLPYVDPERIGINGWSYGGFLTMSMMLKNPGVFRAAVAGGPVIDWKYYEVMYGERYMDTPEANPQGYENASLLNYAKDLRGKLLIIQGYQDETVVPQNCLSFLKKCVDENKQLDFFVYPGHEHNVRGKDRIHLNQKILDYFNDFLK